MTATGHATGGRPPADAPDPGAAAVQPWSWHLSRASALLLAVLVPVHFAVTFLVDDIGDATARSVSERLDDPAWRMVTWLTIALALLHGAIATDRGVRRRLPGTGGLVLSAAVALLAAAGVTAATWVLATRIS